MLINQDKISEYQNQFNKDPNNLIALNCVTNNNLNNVAINREAYQQINHVFSDQIEKEGKATNQKSSGRCWIFAALNMIRLPHIEKYKLDNDFEFSQSYLFFWDKLERSNYFLECIFNTLQEPTDSRVIQHLLNDPLCDGGQWDMFVNLVNKYGLLPKSAYNESYNSSNSRRMNWILTYKLRDYACQIRNNNLQGDKQQITDTILSEVYRVLSIFLGKPPSKFDWDFYDKNKEYHSHKNLTPLHFYQQLVPFNCDDKICVIHDPRNEPNNFYSVKYLGNVVEGRTIKYLNLSIQKLKEYTAKSIKDNNSVWFGCDVGKWYNQEKCVMDTNIYNYQQLFNIEFSLDKTQRLQYGESLMTHAMLFTGVDCLKETNTVTNSNEIKTLKWRVENSWNDIGPQKGYFIMTDQWFDQFVYEIVVDKKYIDDNTLSLIENQDAVVTTFPPWDPLGALALAN